MEQTQNSTNLKNCSVAKPVAEKARWNARCSHAPAIPRKVEPRRAVEAKSFPPCCEPPSKHNAASLFLPASMNSFREIEVGCPADSSSPVRNTVIEESSRPTVARSALRAESITTMPPFMSEAPGPVALAPVRTKCLEGTRRLEDSVQVPDQEQPFPPTPFPFRHHMRRAVHRLHGNPSGLESQRLKLRLDDFSDSDYAWGIKRSRIDVHQALQQRHRRRSFCIDSPQNRRLARGGRLAAREDCPGKGHDDNSETHALFYARSCYPMHHEGNDRARPCPCICTSGDFSSPASSPLRVRPHPRSPDSAAPSSRLWSTSARQ